MTTLYVKDFTVTPGARYRRLGKGSGEEFRDDFLVPAFENDKNLIVNLDGVRGYGSSFLEETFAGLIRLKKFSSAEIKGLVLRLQTENAEWKTEVEEYVNEELAKIGE